MKVGVYFWSFIPFFFAHPSRVPLTHSCADPTGTPNNISHMRFFVDFRNFSTLRMTVKLFFDQKFSKWELRLGVPGGIILIFIFAPRNATASTMNTDQCLHNAFATSIRYQFEPDGWGRFCKRAGLDRTTVNDDWNKSARIMHCGAQGIFSATIKNPLSADRYCSSLVFHDLCYFIPH